MAYDSVNHVYLVVSSHGALNGRFVGQDGLPVGAQFTIQGNPAVFASFPRVAFSPHADAGAGAFLVTWNESAVPTPGIHGRLVGYTRGGAYGADTVLGVNGFMESGPNVAYATGSREFLVAWKDVATADVDVVRVVSVDSVRNTGSALPIVPVAFPRTPDGERDPSVAYSPDQDQFLVAYAGYNNSFAFVAARRVKAGTGVVLDDVVPTTGEDRRIMLTQAAGTYITDTTYNTANGTYLVSWFGYVPQPASIGRLVNTNGTPGAGPTLLSTRWRAYDGLGVAYNAHSNTSFLVSHSDTAEDGGVEILSSGVPYDNGFIATAGGGAGNFYPRIAASKDGSDWLVSTANSFTTTMVQRLSGGAPGSGGGGGGTPPPPPPPPPSCSAGLSVSTINVGGTGGPVGVAVSGNCTWTVTPGAGWVTVTSGGSGTGAGIVILTVARNPGGAARAATVGVGTMSLIVRQAGSVIASVSHDLNGDGTSDLIWRNAATGDLATWYLSANHVVGTFPFTIGRVTDLGWKVVGSGDLDGDGLADLIWQHDQGYLAMWRMQGPQVLSTDLLSISRVSDLNWRVEAAGDVDGDGKADLLWRNLADGRLAIWYMNGASVRATLGLTVGSRPDLSWKIVGAGDINRDGKADVLWQNAATGALDIWAMDGYQVIGQSGPLPGSTNLTWKVGGVGDVNGDGCADLIWQNIATGDLGVWYLNGSSVIGQYGLTLNGSVVRVPDVNWKVVGPG